jgi:hypothetical protein
MRRDAGAVVPTMVAFPIDSDSGNGLTTTSGQPTLIHGSARARRSLAACVRPGGRAAASLSRGPIFRRQEGGCPPPSPPSSPEPR